MRVKLCHGRRSSWQRRYYVCGHHMVANRCDNDAHLQADDAEAKLSEHLRTEILGQIEAKIIGGIRAEIDEASQRFKDRAASVEHLNAELAELRRERQRFVRLAAVTDDPIPEIMEALKANQERAKSLDRAVALASLPPLDLTVAQQLEATAIAEIQRMRERLSGPELREAIVSLFPEGLQLKIKNRLWLIEGTASVPGFRNPDG